MVEARDFRVEIGADGAHGYEVILRAPDGAEAALTMRLPVTAGELEALASRIPDSVIASSATVRRSVPDDERPVQQLGGLLFDAVLGDGGRGMFAASRHQAAREGRQLRMVLQIRPPELARLPWEFLFDAREDDYVCLGTPLIRYPQVLAPVQALQVTTPLRILGMVAHPGDQETLATADERRRLHQALGGLERAGQITLSWVAGPTWRDLRNAMRGGPWQVFHFIGHGGFDPATQEGALSLADDDGRTYQLGAGDLAMLLRGHHSLRLVVLNACDTGRASALDPFSSVAGALIRRGVPAAVAMQQEITDLAALEFSRTFYEALADQAPVDVGVMQARQAIRLALPGSLEWGTPVLYMRSPDGVLFNLTAAPATPQAGDRKPADEDLVDQAPKQDEGELEVLYTRGLAALYTQQWAEAVQAFRAVVADDPGYKDCTGKLGEARRGQRLASLYTAARGATSAGRWAEAIEHFEAVVSAEPGYRDAQALLSQARHDQAIASLRAEAAALHRAGQWQAVLAVGERLRALAPDEPDPDGLISSARAQLQAPERARILGKAYLLALRHIDAGEWQSALQELSTIQGIDVYYRHSTQLAARAHRELARATPISDQAAKLTTIRVPDEVNAVAFSPDAAHLAIACDGCQALVVDLTGREQLQVLHNRASSPVWSVSFDRTTGRFATGSGDRTGRIWDTTGRQLLKVTHADAVFGVAFSPDGDLLATVGLDGTGRIWDTTGKQQITVTHTAPLYCVAFSPDGRLLATGSRDTTARIWDVTTGNELLKVSHKLAVHSVAFSPDGRLLATGSRDNSARIWDVTTGNELLKVTHTQDMCVVAFSPDGRLLATGSGDNTARIWDITTGGELLKVTHTEAVNGVAFSPDGRLLATGSRDKTVQLWQLVEADELTEGVMGLQWDETTQSWRPVKDNDD